MNIETREGLFAVMEQIAEEREAARPIVSKLVASGEPIDDIEIPEGWRTAGMVLELCDYAYSRLENEPAQSLAFAHLALAIATNLVGNAYPPTLHAYLKGRAWKEVGNGNRDLAAYDTSVRSFKAAEFSFAAESALIYEAAVARFLRAGSHFNAENYEESSALNASALDVFQRVKNETREVRCEVLDALIKASKGEFDVARMRLESALEKLRMYDDPHTLGSVYSGLAYAYRALGRTTDSISSLQRAREIFVKLQMPSEINRADWALGTIMVDRGEYGEALPLLNRLRDDFLSRQVPAAAGEIGLLIADALIATGDVDQARQLIRRVLTEFVEAKLNVYAISALAYLRDILEKPEDPKAAVRYVRTYVEKLRTEPTLLFLPLDE